MTITREQAIEAEQAIAALREEPEVPAYRWVQKPDPNKYGICSGCCGCAFRRMPAIRCSRIPCQHHPEHVAELIQGPVHA